MGRIITLTTDFGTDSPYVAQMKAVLYGMVPEVTVVDITHSISPQDIRQGAVVIHDTCRWFPAGTIHIGVVDPGVGTQRRMIVARLEGHIFVGPDNGLMSLWAERSAPDEVITVDRPEFWRQPVSNTFHGRDIMAPVAAHLARGVALHEIGSRRDSWCRLSWSRPQWHGNFVSGEVVLVDRFGNLLTNILHEDLQEHGVHAQAAWLFDNYVRIVETYGQATQGTLVGLFGSQGRFEIAVVEGNAARSYNATVGTPVRIEVTK